MTTTGNQRIGRAGKGLPSSKHPFENNDAGGKPVASSAKNLAGKHPELAVAPVEQSTPGEAAESYSTLSIDKAFKAHLARFTLGISPAGIVSKYFEWLAHLAVSPGKQLQLIEKAQRKNSRFTVYASSYMRDFKSPPCIEPLPQDRRFNHESWQSWPYNFMYQAFLLTQQWWDNATNNVDGLSRKDEQAISFVTRQIIDHFSPSNFIWTNPEVAQATLAQSGNNLALGFKNFLEDWERAISGKPPAGVERFVVGRDVATSPGKVVYRNRLIELIQYSPTTDKVHPEPILIVPAWIMKYYILDLSPYNSMVKYLVERGFTVFMISWRNPTSADRDLGMEDYLELGVESALRAVGAVVQDRKVHAVGYCIGGTLLAIAAAAMARDHDDTLKTLTFLTTQTDFTDAGELMLFVRESGLSYLENMMWDQGYLDTKQMAGAFQMLRSTDMIWSRYVREYLMGERPKMFDLIAWNADATRMPYRMHSEYLRKLYLSNELARGQYRVKGRPVTLSDVRTPIFAVATTSDHVAPWQSVYKFHLLTDTDLTFVLTNGGHNAGIVSEPGRKGRRFQIATRRERETYVAPDEWVQQSPATEGSWWTAWTEWLAAHSQAKTSLPPMGASSKGLRVLGDAPGIYVRQL
jgi:polyhydroxyalkanoate synthase subunit PhaC